MGKSITKSDASILAMAMDVERYPSFVPTVHVGTIPPTSMYCRAWNSKRLKYCKQTAGHNTDHKGEGRCAWHSGNAPIKHGIYSTVTRSSLKEHLEQIRSQDVSERMDLTNEVDMVRALAADFIATYDERVDALIAWNRNEAIEAVMEERRARPLPIPDITAVADILMKAATLADKMHAQLHRDSITKRDFFRLQDAQAEVVVNVLTEMFGELDASAAIDRIRERWDMIQL